SPNGNVIAAAVHESEHDHTIRQSTSGICLFNVLSNIFCHAQSEQRIFIYPGHNTPVEFTTHSVRVVRCWERESCALVPLRLEYIRSLGQFKQTSSLWLWHPVVLKGNPNNAVSHISSVETDVS